MRGLTKILLTTTAIVQFGTIGALGQYTYQLDNGSVGGAFNNSDATEPLANWIGNEFTAIAGSTLINRVDVGIFTVTPGTTAQLAIYQLSPLYLTPHRIYTQTFTPVPGNGSTVNLNQISLTTPTQVVAGQAFLVSILIQNVIAAPPNDVYPWAFDTGTSAAGSFWARSAPNTFNLDDLSQAYRIDQGLPPDGSGAPPYIVGTHHLFVRAIGVPEPSTFALAGLGAAALLIFRRRAK